LGGKRTERGGHKEREGGTPEEKGESIVKGAGREWVSEEEKPLSGKGFFGAERRPGTFIGKGKKP